MPVHYGGNTLGAEAALCPAVALRNTLHGHRLSVQHPHLDGTLVVADGADAVHPVVLLLVSFTEHLPVTFPVFPDNIHHHISSLTGLTPQEFFIP